MFRSIKETDRVGYISLKVYVVRTIGMNVKPQQKALAPDGDPSISVWNVP
jgi:hypothetical protein